MTGRESTGIESWPHHSPALTLPPQAHCGDTVLLAWHADGLNSSGEYFLLFEEVRRFLKASIPWLFAPDTTFFFCQSTDTPLPLETFTVVIH